MKKIDSMNLLENPVIKELLSGTDISLADANKRLEQLCKDDTEFVEMCSNTYRYKDYFIDVALRFNLISHAHNIRRDAEMNLKCMPRFIAYNNMSDHHCILITEVPGIAKTLPLPYKENRAIIPIDSRINFYYELEEYIRNAKMVPRSLLHEESFWNCMAYIPSTKTLMVTNWSEEIGCSSSEACQNFLMSVCNRLNIPYKDEREAKIQLRNIPTWIIDQLKRPRWFSNFFITRNARGAFSIYSHVRRKDGLKKVTYPTKDKANKAAEAMKKKHKTHFSVYKCLYCDGWHIGKKTVINGKS